VDIGHRVSTICHLAVTSRAEAGAQNSTGIEQEKFVNDAEADAYAVAAEMRSPWKLARKGDYENDDSDFADRGDDGFDCRCSTAGRERRREMSFTQWTQTSTTQGPQSRGNGQAAQGSGVCGIWLCRYGNIPQWLAAWLDKEGLKLYTIYVGVDI